MESSAPPSRRTTVAALLAGVTLSACAHTVPRVSPSDIPRLERELAADPEDAGLRAQLGMARFEAGEYEPALAALESAVEGGEESGPALLYLGMTYEEFERWSDAREAYNRYLDAGRSGAVKAEIEKRLQLLGQRVLRERARVALSREAELTGAEVEARSVAVLPFGFNSDREDIEPLIYALSDMMITDFAVSNALTVLERSRIQTLLDEMALTEAGYADAATGARAGRLLGAEHVVQGVLTTLGQADLRVDTDVLNVPRSASAGTLDAQDALENLFDLEKDLVFRTLRDVLGVELTPAEEQAILDNRADNVLAFVAYGRGLRERDRGNYAAAVASFQQAAQLDPSFGAAAAAAGETEAMREAAGAGTSAIAQVAATSGETGGGGAVSPPPPGAASGVGSQAGSTAGALSNASEGVNPTPTSGTIDLGTVAGGGGGTPQSTEKRDPVQESQSQEGVTKPSTARIRVVIRRPGGGS